MKNGFDGWAAEYQGGLEDPAKRIFSGSYGNLVSMKIRILRDLKEETFGSRKIRVLDFGCGTGEIAAGLSRLPGIQSVLALDESREMILQAKKRHGERAASVTWRHFQEKLPREKFDWVIAVNTFHHILPSMRKSIARKLLACLKPGGSFAILEHNPLNPLTRWIVRRCPFDWGVRLLSPKEVRSLVVQRGGTARTWHLGFCPPFLPGAHVLEKAFRGIPLGVQFLVYLRGAGRAHGPL